MIRPAEEADLKWIEALDGVSRLPVWSSHHFSSYLGQGALFLVMETRGGLVGYAVLRLVLPEAELLRIAIATPWRGQGLAHKLLGSGLREAVTRGVKTCFLEVRSSNTVARKLYTAHGFEALARRPAYYLDPVEDAIVMRLDLRGQGRHEAQDE